MNLRFVVHRRDYVSRSIREPFGGISFPSIVFYSWPSLVRWLGSLDREDSFVFRVEVEDLEGVSLAGMGDFGDAGDVSEFVVEFLRMSAV